MHSGGEGEVNWEIRFDIKTLQYVKYITSVILLYSIVRICCIFIVQCSVMT